MTAVQPSGELHYQPIVLTRLTADRAADLSFVGASLFCTIIVEQAVANGNIFSFKLVSISISSVSDRYAKGHDLPASLLGSSGNREIGPHFH